MIKKLLTTILLMTSLLQAATITSQQASYPIGQTITLSLSGLSQDRDWVGLYPAGASNDWGNVIAWKWTGNVAQTTLTFNAAIAGAYEARVFFHNSFTTEASVSFSVTANQQAATLTTSKDTYNDGEAIVVTVGNMAGNNNDWVGIYPVGASNAWGNVVAWKYTNGLANGNLNLGAIPAGDYEARAFFNNSYHLEASHTFTVNGAAAHNTSITTSQDTYNVNEPIMITMTNMAGNNNDWVAIYPAGASNDWGNVIAWKYTNGAVNGTLNLGAIASGNYEVRAFFNNSFNLEASHAFSVQAVNLPPTVYEDAENGLANWVTMSGRFDASRHTANGHNFVKLIADWHHNADGSWSNPSSYKLTMNNTSQKILSVDLGGDGQNMPHYQLGVRCTTTYGVRLLKWSSFYVHRNIPESKKDYANNVSVITFHSPVEQVRGWGYADVNLWQNFTVNLEDALHQFEPNNTITAVDYFYATGGNLDNITLK